MDINGCCERSALLVYARNLLLSQSFMDLTGRYCTPVQIVCPLLSRAWLAEHPARSPLRRPELLTYTHHTTSSALGTQKFPLAASSRISLSSVKSATARFRRPFSRSSSFRRRAWLTFIPPYSRLISFTDLPRARPTSASRSAVMICSGVGRFLPILTSSCGQACAELPLSDAEARSRRSVEDFHVEGGGERASGS